MPLLSVVVPFHDVGPYFTACLESLRRQSLSDIEIVLVDDGSSDSSRAIAEQYRSSDDRFRLVVRENGGPGPARNTGIEHARGEYLAFADADDVVHPQAYEHLVGSLQSSGSDFAIGMAYRFNNLGMTPSYSQLRAVTGRYFRTHISEHPELVLDRMVWNKVYRRSFWDAEGFEFAAILMQDYPVTVAAHTRAKAVDVLTDTVYYWRERDDGIPSITQRSGEAQSMRDRVTSAFAVLDVVEREAPYALPLLHQHLLTVDLPALVAGADSVPEHAQRLADRLEAGNVADLVAKASLPWKRPVPTQPGGRVDDAVWTERGLALRVLVELPDPSSGIALHWEDGAGGTIPAEFEVVGRKRPSQDPHLVELRTVLDPDVLVAADPKALGFHALILEVTNAAGVAWTGLVTRPSEGRGAYILPRPAPLNRRVLFQPYRREHRFGVQVQMRRVPADDCVVEAGTFVLSGRVLLPEVARDARVVVAGTSISVPVVLDLRPNGVTGFRARLDAAQLARDPDLLAPFGLQHHSELRLISGDEDRSVTAGADFTGASVTIGHRSVAIVRTSVGHLTVLEQRVAPTLTGVAWVSRSVLRFTGSWRGEQRLPGVVHCRYGRAAGAPAFELRLRGRGNAYSFDVNVAALVRAQRSRPRHAGSDPWHLLVPFADHVATQVLDRDALSRFAEPRFIGGYRVSLVCSVNDVVRLVLVP
jgi:GT2 family glycosyltransferase